MNRLMNVIKFAFMKKIVLVRHAQAQPIGNATDDYSRLLTNCGREDAEMMAIKMKKLGLNTDLIVSSSAKRAQTTASIFARVFGINEEVISFDERLYQAGSEYLLQKVRQLNDGSSTVFIFGHNPSISQFVSFLTNEPCLLAPCSVACVQFEVNDWEFIFQGNGILKWIEEK